MRSTLTRVIVTMVVGLAVLAACAEKEGGTATPAPPGNGGVGTGTPEPTGSAPAGPGAPKVADPLGVDRYLNEPCAVLSDAQLQSFNISKPGDPEIDTASGPGCSWRTDHKPVQRGLEVGFITPNKNGLSDIYRGGREAFPGYFEPTEVDGYPAVLADAVDGREGGACQIIVGISDTLAFGASEQADRSVGVQSCADVKQFAAAVLKTLKET